MNIIGIGGLPRSGKDSLAELLIEEGYYGVSLGDIVREASRQRHTQEPDPISVKNMTETANFLRSQHGPDFALKEALQRYAQAQQKASYKGLVVFSVRMPVEADFILKHDGVLIWVEASDDVRHQRSLQFRREGEAAQTKEEMLDQEALQEKPQPHLPAEIQMNTSYVKAHASLVVENNSNNVEKFRNEAKKILSNVFQNK